MIGFLRCFSCVAFMLGATFARAGQPEAAISAAQPVRVERFEFRGNRVLHLDVLRGAAAPYVGRDLTASDIDALRVALTRLYSDRGYVNSGVILDPDAPYHDGVLSFLAIEGQIKEVHVRGLKGLRPSYVIDRVRGQDDEVLNGNVLRERFLQLSEDPLFSVVNSRIDTIAEPGDANLDVEVQRARPYSLTLALNNYRPPSIGEKGYDFNAEIHDLTGYGDVLDADVSGPVEFSGGVGYAFSWQTPFNARGSLVSLSAARINTVVTEEPLSVLDIRSTIDRQELKLTQPLWNTSRGQFNLSASVADEKESTEGDLLFSLLPGSGEGVTRSVTLRFMPDFSYRTERQFFGAKLTLLYASLIDIPANAAPDSLPDKRYFVWSGQLHHVLEFAHAPLELESRATVQRTDSRVADLHLLEIGGVNSVRGFRENEFLASNVTNLNMDFRWIALRAGATQRPDLAIGTFFDWAAGHDVGESADTFSSYGFTFRLKWPHFMADVAYGLPLIHPSFVTEEHGSWQDHGIHVQIATTL